MPKAEFLPGDGFKNYRIERKLGQGGFGTAYLATSLRSGAEVALKVLKPGAIPADEALFVNEALRLMQLKHPRIIPVEGCDIDPHADYRYLVMGYAPMGALDDHVPSSGMAPVQSIGIIEQTAEGLQFVHEQQFLHRDVKPQNVLLLNHQFDIWLTDFGLALAAHDVPVPSAIGTPAYMAPEAIKKYPSVSSDQFSLAVIAYELLCGKGRLPFPTMQDNVRSEPVPFARQVTHLTAVLAELEHVVKKALAKKEEDRYPRVVDFAEALKTTFAQALNANLRDPGAIHPNPHIQPNLPVLTHPDVQPVPHHQQPNPDRQPQSNQAPVPDQQPQPNPIAQPLPEHLQPHPNPNSQRNPNLQPVPQGTVIEIYRGHKSYVTSVAWSPDGKRIASADNDGGLYIWEAADGKYEYFSRPGHTSVKEVAWSPDGRRIAAAVWYGDIRVWSAVDGRNELTYEGHRRYVTPHDVNADFTNAVAWSPDGKRIASGAGTGGLHVWDAADGSLIRVGDSDRGIASIAWSPDGSLIAFAEHDVNPGYEGSLKVWNPDNGKFLFTFTTQSFFNFLFESVAWSPDGTRIVSGNYDGRVLVWEATTGNLLYTYSGHFKRITAFPGHSSRVTSVAWSPDGKRIASAGDDGTVQVWDAADGRNAYIYEGHIVRGYRHNVLGLAWSPDGKYIASGGTDKAVHIWGS